MPPCRDRTIRQEIATGAEHHGLQLGAADGACRVRREIEIGHCLPVVTHVERQRHPGQRCHLAGDGDQGVAHGRSLPGGVQRQRQVHVPVGQREQLRRRRIPVSPSVFLGHGDHVGNHLRSHATSPVHWSLRSEERIGEGVSRQRGPTGICEGPLPGQVA